MSLNRDQRFLETQEYPDNPSPPVSGDFNRDPDVSTVKSPDTEGENVTAQPQTNTQQTSDQKQTRSVSPEPRNLIAEQAAKTDATQPLEVNRICPRVNCPEKIIICLDLAQDMEKVTFRSRAGDKFAPLKLVKRALGIFLQSKHRLDRRHEFALVVFHDTAMWVHDLTNDPDSILNFVDDLNQTYPAETCELGSIFDVVSKQVALPTVDDPRLLPPPYIVRVVLIYGRSHCLPKFESKEAQKLLQSSPHFFIDAYYIHEPPSDENQCEAIFDTLCELDTNGLSYVFEVSRNPTKLYDCMAQLLPHPLQRPLQRDAEYAIETLPVEQPPT